MSSKECDENTYPWPNLNGTTVEVWVWIGNSIAAFIMDVITYPCCDQLNHVDKRGIGEMCTRNEHVFYCKSYKQMFSIYTLTKFCYHSTCVCHNESRCCAVTRHNIDNEFRQDYWNFGLLIISNQFVLSDKHTKMATDEFMQALTLTN